MKLLINVTEVKESTINIEIDGAGGGEGWSVEMRVIELMIITPII